MKYAMHKAITICAYAFERIMNGEWASAYLKLSILIVAIGNVFSLLESLLDELKSVTQHSASH